MNNDTEKGREDIFAAPCLTSLAPHASHAPWQICLSGFSYLSLLSTLYFSQWQQMLTRTKEAGLALTRRRNALGKMAYQGSNATESWPSVVITSDMWWILTRPNDQNRVTNYLMHHSNKASAVLFFLVVNPSSNLKISKCNGLCLLLVKVTSNK